MRFLGGPPVQLGPVDVRSAIHGHSHRSVASLDGTRENVARQSNLTRRSRDIEFRGFWLVVLHPISFLARLKVLRRFK